MIVSLFLTASCFPRSHNVRRVVLVNCRMSLVGRAFGANCPPMGIQWGNLTKPLQMFTAAPGMSIMPLSLPVCAALPRPPAPARPSPISDSDRPYLCDIQLLRQRYRATRARSVNQLLPNPESRDTQLSFVPLLGEAPSEDQAYYPVHSRPVHEARSHFLWQ